MDTKTLLEQLLTSAKDAASQGRDLAEEKLGVPDSGTERDAMLSGMGKGALAAGVLALLLGTQSGRRVTGTAIKLGGLAAIGGFAYQAIKRWQEGQERPTVDECSTITELSSNQANERGRLLLRAMIAASKADGHINAGERVRINEQIMQLGMEDEAAEFIRDELGKPLDPTLLAEQVDSAKVAAEVYLVSRVVLDLEDVQERAYLEHLIDALKMDPALVEELDKQINT